MTNVIVLMEDHDPCQESLYLDKRIADAKKTLQDSKKNLEDLVAQKYKTLAKINHLHDPITHRFPTEIISIIFQHALPDNYTNFDQLFGKPAHKGLISGPLFLGGVCNAWRRIAWSTSSMWTVVRLVMKTMDDNYDRVDVLKSWLDRAGELPLSIRIGFWANGGYNIDQGAEDAGLVDGLIDLVNRESYRWNELEVQAPPWLFRKINKGIYTARKLQTLRAAVTGDDDDNGTEVLLDSPNARLTLATLHTVYFQQFKIDWSHVTRISVWRFFSDECVEFLRCAVRLLHCEFLEVIRSPYRPTFQLPDQPIIHSTLQTLCIFPDGDQELGSRTLAQRAILNSFIFPPLRAVELLGTDVSSLSEMIDRSSCPITFLNIPTEGFAVDISLRSILSKVPMLESLFLTSEGGVSTTKIVYPFLDQLAASSAPTPSAEQSVSDSAINQIIVPNLKFLTLIGFSRTDGLWQHLSHIFGPVADIRHPDRRPLKKLQVERHAEINLGKEDYIDRQTVLKFMELRGGGIVLDFSDKLGKNGLLDLSISHYALNTPRNNE